MVLCIGVDFYFFSVTQARNFGYVVLSGGVVSRGVESRGVVSRGVRWSHLAYGLHFS